MTQPKPIPVCKSCGGLELTALGVVMSDGRGGWDFLPDHDLSDIRCLNTDCDLYDVDVRDCEYLFGGQHAANS